MKKYISIMMMALLFSFGFTSCDPETDEEAGGTAVQKMAGNWDVKLSIVDENGNVLVEDPDDMGVFAVTTYNTAANTNNEMWITDNKNFWQFTMKVDVNYAARTFSCTDRDYDAAGTGKATITGKVLEGAAKNLHGMPNDSIVFDVKFSDDEDNLIWRFSGQRYTGFYE